MVILSMAEDEESNMAVEDIISRVRGGSSGWGGGLTQNGSIITYRAWGRSLKYNPAVIDFEVSLFAVEETLRPRGMKVKQTRSFHISYYEPIKEQD